MKGLEFEKVVKRYDDRLVVDHLNFQIEPSSLYGLLGPNGAGKSTLIAMLCGITKMDKGDIRVGGYSINKEPKKVKELIGYVPQELAIFDNLTVKQNLDYFAGMYGLRGKVKKERIEEALELTGLKNRHKDKIKKLSGGMKRRLNIACAILHHPEVLVMDEPTVGIDPQSRNHILKFAKELNEKNGTTIIYTSHYMEEIQTLCDQLLILDEGQEIIKGTKEQVLKSVVDETGVEITLRKVTPELIGALSKLDGVKEVMVKEETVEMIVQSSMYKMENILEVIGDFQGGIININIDEPNLETVFLSLTGRQLRD